MTKKLITALLSLSLALPLTVYTASAAPLAPSVAIIDNGIDDTLPAFQGKIVTQVCILEVTLCPNGKQFEESLHAAVLPPLVFKTSPDGDHGTMLASNFVANNSNSNIVFIRIVGHDEAGQRINPTETGLNKALEWVKNNSLKYNIQAVTVSMGSHNVLGAAGTDYCPKTPITEQIIKDLISVNVPAFMAVGNNADYKRIDWPSCIPSSVAIGHVDRGDLIGSTSNNDISLLDFYATGYVTVASAGNIMKNVQGSSFAVPKAAALWMLLRQQKPLYTYDQIMSSFKNTSLPTAGKAGKFIKLMSLDNALLYTPAQAGPTAAEIAAAQAVAKAALKAQVDDGIAAAQAEYDATVKLAADKLAASKAAWLAKLNG